MNFDRAKLRGGMTGGFTDCTLRAADLSGARLNPTEFVRCDASGANFSKTMASYTRATDTTFAGASFREADFGQSVFPNLDLGAADFTGADLAECNFEGSNLSNARLNGANLTRAKLAKADLTGADFRGANLADADLTDAKVGGADFRGANLLGAALAGVDVSGTQGLDATAATFGTPGPVCWNWSRWRARRRRSSSTPTSTCPKGAWRSNVRVAGGRCRADYQFFVTGEARVRYEDGEGTSVPECVLRAAKRWGKQGTLRLDEFKVEAKGSPVTPHAARELVTDAWCEAVGLDRGGALAAQAAVMAKNRDAWVARWRTGPAGVKAWNKADAVDLWRAGSFAGVDAAGTSSAASNSPNSFWRGRTSAARR